MENNNNLLAETQETLEQMKELLAQIQAALEGPAPAGENLIGKVDVNSVPQSFMDSLVKWDDLEKALESIRKAAFDSGVAEFDKNVRQNTPFLKGVQEDVPENEDAWAVHKNETCLIDKIYLITNESANDVKLKFSSYNKPFGDRLYHQELILHPGETIKNIDVKAKEIYINTAETNASGPSKIRMLYRCVLKEKE